MTKIAENLDVIIDEDALQKRISELAGEITRDLAEKNPVLIGTLKGGFTILAALSLQLDFDLEIDFITAKSYGDNYQSSGKVDLFKNLTVDLKDRHVLLVEDIVDSGLTLKYILEDFQLVKPKSVSVLTLLDKKPARRVDVPIDYIGFEIENNFVVGFGLDYSEKYRNLPYIAVLKELK